MSFNCEEEKMSNPKQSLQNIHDTVRSGYAQIAAGPRSCCCSGKKEARFGHENPTALARAMGYDEVSLHNLPEGANMGLSCGNPLAIAQLLPGQTVIDLGSGGGFDAFQAGEKVGASGQVIGVDMTPEMISKARSNIEHYARRSKLNNVEFRLGEIEHIPVADASIDVVLSNCVINLSPDKQQVWSDIYRVLKTGGKVAVSDLALLRPLPTAVQKLAAALVGCVAGAILISDTQSILQKTGFRNINLVQNPAYVRQMLEWNDPLYREIAEALPGNRKIYDYVVSLSIEAYK